VSTDGVTTYINASSMNLRYKPVNKPVIFDLPLPPGVTKNWTSRIIFDALQLYCRAYMARCVVCPSSSSSV